MFLSQNDTLYFIHETSHSTCMFCASQIAFWATKNKCPVQEVTWNFMFRSVASLHSHVEQWEPKFFFFEQPKQSSWSQTNYLLLVASFLPCFCFSTKIDEYFGFSFFFLQVSFWNPLMFLRMLPCFFEEKMKMVNNLQKAGFMNCNKIFCSSVDTCIFDNMMVIFMFSFKLMLLLLFSLSVQKIFFGYSCMRVLQIYEKENLNA